MGESVTEVIVATSVGRLRGRIEEDLAVFRGVRYAEPPVGPLRFRAPVSARDPGHILDALEFGPIAPQPEPLPGTAIPGDSVAYDEDCLSLNIWSPGCDEGRRPVMVFVHGGSFVTGAGSWSIYRGEHLARLGVVVVTINYRLGVLGFLGHRCLADPGDPTALFANFGLADQVAALDFVRGNIASFGGDPENVTIFGESAGGMSVACLLGSSAASGLFGRAIIESGPAVALSIDRAGEIAEGVAAELGIGTISRRALEEVPVQRLLVAQARVAARFEEVSGLAFQPVVDGRLLPMHPLQAIAAGSARGVDLLIGTNRDEFRFFTISAPELVPSSDEALVAAVERYLELPEHLGNTLGLSRAPGPSGAKRAEALIEEYRSGSLAARGALDLESVVVALASDFVFRIPSLRLALSHSAAGSASYVYLFTWESPIGNGLLGSCHALELPFVFGTLANPIVALFSGGGDDAHALSATIQQCWVNFARSGDPSSERAGPWPAYDSERRPTMVLGPACGVEDDPLRRERVAWDEVLEGA